MKLRRSFVATCAGLVAALAVGTVPARADDDLSLLLDFAPWGLHAGAHLAAQKGWFKEQKLNVSIRDGRGSVSTIQLVGAGEADIGMAQLGPMAAARHKSGIALKSFMGLAQNGDLAAVVDAKSGIKTIADLKGKKLVLFAASPFLPFLDTFLKAGGMTRNDVELLYVEPSAMMATYTAGRADGVLTAGPYGQSMAEKTRPSSLVLATQAGISYPSYGYFSTEKVLAEKKAPLQRFAAVQARAFEYIYKNGLDEGVAAIVAARPDVKLDPTILKRQLELYADFFATPNTKGKKIGWQAEADWAAAIKSMAEAGVIEARYKPGDFYTNEIVGE